MLSSSLAVLLLSALLPAVCGEISSTITSITDDYNLTLASPTDEMYLSRPSYVTIDVSPIEKFKDVRTNTEGKHINLTISTNNSQVIGSPAETTLQLSMNIMKSELRCNVTQNTPQFTEPINVTVNVSDSGKSMSISLLLIDDRVDVGFLHNDITCISNEACFLEIIAKMTPTVSEMYVTMSVPGAGVDEEMFPIASLVPKYIVIKATGHFTASLSVPNKYERKVYLSRQNMLIHVTPNKWMEELNELRRNYTILYQQYQNLSNFIMVHKIGSVSPPPTTDSTTTDSTTTDSTTTDSATTDSTTTDLTTTDSTTTNSTMTNSTTMDLPTLDSQKAPNSTLNATTVTVTSSASATPTASETTTAASVPELPNDNTLMYGGLMAFIAVLVVCVAAYLLYHNKDKLLELIGGKKESVVEMAMKSRSKKSKGYQKLPTSIHDTMTHED